MFIHVFTLISLHKYVAIPPPYASWAVSELAFWTDLQWGPPGFTDPAGFVTAAQAVHVISPLETHRRPPSSRGFPGNQGETLHSRALSDRTS